jgi:hypothetical protein
VVTGHSTSRRETASKLRGNTLGLGEGKSRLASFSDDLRRSRRHVAGLLESVGFAYSEDRAATWIAPFADELDPTFVIAQWLDAGWRDAQLVAAAQSICGSVERATDCMALLGIETSSLHEDSIVRGLMDAVGQLPRHRR